jgi:hypothetical protein
MSYYISNGAAQAGPPFHYPELLIRLKGNSMTKKIFITGAGVVLFLLIPGIFMFFYDALNFDRISYITLCVKYLVLPSVIISFLLVFKFNIIDGKYDSTLLRSIFFLLFILFFTFVSFGGCAILINKYCGTRTEIDIRGKVSKHSSRNYKVNTTTYYLTVYDNLLKKSFEFEVNKDIFDSTKESEHYRTKIKKGSLGIYYW